jgi:signal transduction histidine kinase
LFDPIVRLGLAERRTARLLACLLLALTALGLAVAFAQLALVPNFRGTFVYIACAISVLGLAYVASRTHFYRISAMVACAVPVVACLAVGARNPDDHVWYAFMLIGVIFASVFFEIKVAVLAALAVFAALCALMLRIPALSRPERFVPVLALHAVLSPLLLIAAHHHRSLERERQAKLNRRNLQLAEKSRLEALGHLAGSFAHDFANLLAVCSANASVLQRQLGEKSKQSLDEIRMASDKATALSRQLLAFAAGRPSKPQLISVDELVAKIEPLLARLAGLGVELVTTCDPQVSPIRVDPLDIEQALMNLVLNARDAMPDGGVVSIETTQVVLDRTYVQQHHGARFGPHVMITVRDTGEGMDDATLARAFEPFFTTKPEGFGTGLGLATVQSIAERNEGHVTASSQPGKGSTFRLYLPCVER